MDSRTKSKTTCKRHFIRKNPLRVQVNGESFTLSAKGATLGRETIDKVVKRGDEALSEGDHRLAHQYWQAAEYLTRESETNDKKQNNE